MTMAPLNPTARTSSAEDSSATSTTSIACKMAPPATPRRGIFGRLVGTISQIVATPRRPSPVVNKSPWEPDSATVPSPAATMVESPPSPPAQEPELEPEAEQWHPGMLQSKYLLEYENMWDDIIKTPRPQSTRKPRTCPPKLRNTQAKQMTQMTQADQVEMPRSAMKKKRSAPIDVEEPTTPSNNKRVKFNPTLTQERILSPPQSGERELAPLHQPGVNCSKKRPRATDPYTGRHFADSPNIFNDESPSKRVRYEAPSAREAALEVGDESTCDSDPTPTTRNNTIMNKAIFDDGFVPTRSQPRPGTFALDYNTYGEGDDLSVLSEEGISQDEATPRYNPPDPNKPSGRFALDFSDESSLPDASTSSLLNDPTPTPGPTNPPTQETSSSPPQTPPLELLTTQPQEKEIESTQLESPNDDNGPTTPPLHEHLSTARKAAIDAEVDALAWPAPTTYVEAGIASQEVINLLDKYYDDDDRYYANVWWEREFPKFTDALEVAKREGREVVYEY